MRSAYEKIVFNPHAEYYRNEKGIDIRDIVATIVEPETGEQHKTIVGSHAVEFPDSYRVDTVALRYNLNLLGHLGLLEDVIIVQ